MLPFITIRPPPPCILQIEWKAHLSQVDYFGSVYDVLVSSRILNKWTSCSEIRRSVYETCV